MDSIKKAKVEDYVEKKEQSNEFGKLAETVADLTGVEEEVKEGFLNKWLKNNKNLLEYAELYNKPEKLNIGESIKFKLLEVKLSITCPYFVDFKDFLEELKRGMLIPTTDIPEVGTTATGTSSITEAISESSEIQTHTFCGTNIKNIKSEPFEKNSKTGVTWCSKTARLNGRNFGITLPTGNAYDAGKLPGKDCVKSIPENKKGKRPQKSWKGIELSMFKSISKGNYADIYVESKSNYGHRAAAFRDDSGQWYVLDPYIRVNGRLDNSPKKLEDYIKARKIVKAHIYESKGYRQNSSDDDQGTGYEWGNG